MCQIQACAPSVKSTLYIVIGWVSVIVVDFDFNLCSCDHFCVRWCGIYQNVGLSYLLGGYHSFLGYCQHILI